jgi:arsenite-transporting ATPase
MRLLLFTGKGGVGKTTVAAATAVHAARCGVKTLVVSTDAAHSLGDCLAAALGRDPVELEPGLSAVQVDARARGERSWRVIQEYLIGLLDEVGVDPLSGEELTALPGVEEVLALLEVRDLVAEGGHDLVVVDCAPTADTLRLLALPEVLRRLLETALPVQRRVLRAMTASARGGRQARGGRPGPPPRDPVVEAAERLHLELTGVREVLAAPGTSVRLVLTPETVVIAEARRAWTSLALYGYTVDGVVANRLVPAGGRDAWRGGWVRAQAERLEQVQESFGSVPVLRADYAATEPVGLEAVALLGVQLYGAARPGAAQSLLVAPPSRDGLQVERDGEEFVLTLPLPLASREDLELARVEDDLRVTVAGRCRVVALPSGLRRCDVTGAALREGRLQVRFRPDPALWRQS